MRQYKIYLAGIWLMLIFAPSIEANTVSGIVRYRNITYDTTGYKSSAEWTWLAVRQAKVQIIKQLAVGEQILGESTTDNTGAYSIIIPDESTQPIFLRVRAGNDVAPYTISVKNDPTNNQIYTAASPTQNLDTNVAQTINLDIPLLADGGIAEAFNIFDVAVWAYQYVVNLGATTTPLLTIYWKDGSTDGTYFNPATNTVHLLGTSADPDQWDDDIILHEIGHLIAYTYSRDDSPGGAHTITGQYDPRLTWSEGWAHYFSVAVRKFAGLSLYSQPQIIVDTKASGTSASWFDVELPSNSSLAIMATNELAVAAAVLDFQDDTLSENIGPDTGIYDALFLGNSPIWKGFVALKSLPATNFITLEDFYIHLQIQNALTVTQVNQAKQILYARKIKYFVDALEGNNTSATATLINFAGSTQASFTELTFYPTDAPNYTALDANWFVFSYIGGGLTIRTSALGDGCDTTLSLYDSALNLLASNDNKAPGEKSSEIVTTVSSGTYYFAVRPYDGSGKVVDFGYYDLAVTLQVDVSSPTTFSLLLPQDEDVFYTDTLTLSWNPSYHLSGVSYRIRVSTDPLFVSGFAEYITGSTQVTISSLANAQYFWYVIAEAGNGTFTISDDIRSFVILSNAPDASPPGVSMPGGIDASAYRMISSPVELAGTEVQQLENLLGPWTPTLWRMFRWQTIPGYYVEYPGGAPPILPFRPGRSYWLVRAAPYNLTFSGKSLHQLLKFAIRLKPGWTQIANPFTGAVNWSDVVSAQRNPDGSVTTYNANDLANTLIIPNLYFWDGAYFYSSQLVPYYGYFVKNKTDKDVYLIMQNPGPALPKPYYLKVPDWEEGPPLPPQGLQKTEGSSSRGSGGCLGMVSVSEGYFVILLLLVVLFLLSIGLIKLRPREPGYRKSC